MRLLKGGEHKRMPWKNGGGETIEIAVHPPGVDLAGFDWRISMARVAADGPFSRFDGIDRTLAVLSGAGMDLEIAGLGRRGLTPDSEPLFFPADASTQAWLRDGPITDLNVMTRRGACRHRVTRRVVRDGERLVTHGRRGFVLPRAPCRIAAEATSVDAVAGDAVALDAPGTVEVFAESGPVTVHVVEIDP